MISRNRALVRSVAFGGLTKVGGGLVVVLGLPLIAHGLSVDAYAAFLKAMTSASIITLAFGAAGTVSVRDIARALKAGTDQLHAAERRTFGLFVVIATVTLAVAALATPFNLAASPHAGIIGFATLLVLLQGLAQWGEVNRVASRSDHLSSLWQFSGNVVILLLLIVFSRFGLLPVVMIYFAVPMVIQVAVFIHLMVQRRSWVVPRFSVGAVISDFRAMVPVAGNSFADYAKIFLSGLLVSRLSVAADFGLYMTLVLFAARLVNPLSLVTRPLMPAYLDALHHDDRHWLKAVRTALLIFASIAFIGGAGIVAMLDPSFFRAIIPEKLGEVSRPEIASLMLFLWGHGFTTLLTPLFYAADRDRLLWAVNGGFVGLGLVVGGLLTVHGGATAMLAAMAACSALAALTLLGFAALRLLSRDPANPLASASR
ncbi:MAG: hypothetical protein EON59_03080 [Alphaproteobacteria bacterium]|nr:MAG: hypothetical protein EON59_03080 [Alphaproteobacteria bacterium]